MRPFIFLSLFLAFLAPPQSALESHHEHHLCTGFVPENDLWIGPEVKSFKGVNQNIVDQILDDAGEVYGPIVAQKGGQLVLRNLWSEGKVNAQAYRSGRNYIVEIFGGLARHSAITADAVMLVVCHEIGHHIGGTPKFSEDGGEWASVEGQSDYFATTKCLRKIWGGQSNQVDSEDPEARKRCDAAWPGSPSESDLCVRIAMAGKSSASMFYQMDGGSRAPSFSTPDSRVVNVTFEEHPQYQCRLDTYFNGGLCEISDTVDLSDRDEEAGACTHAKGHKEGWRPLCWFKPRSTSGGGGTGGGQNPPPPPTGSVARSPVLNGQTDYMTHNPAEVISLQWNVSEFSGAGGVYVEVSRTNSPLSSPNGNQPDRNHLAGVTKRGTRGELRFSAQRDLPGWGTYYIRVIPLDSTGRQAVGLFSNSSQFRIEK